MDALLRTTPGEVRREQIMTTEDLQRGNCTNLLYILIKNNWVPFSNPYKTVKLVSYSFFAIYSIYSFCEERQADWLCSVA
jgi:hypothetical protein